MTELLGSIVIPAYNEEVGIGRCLERLFTDLPDDLVEVVVACNGCTDRTVERARAFGHGVVVLDLPEPGKVGALRAGEHAVNALPRVYLDADVEVSGEAIRAVLVAVGSGAIAARPAARYDLTGCSWIVRRFYRARSTLPIFTRELCVGGIYALSAAARARFEEFPDVIADDLFAARIVRPDEVVIVDTDPLIIHVPRTAGSVMKVLKRVFRGNAELAELHPGLAVDTAGATARELVGRLRRPSTAIDALVYAAFVIGARVLIRFERAPARWERDETSRAA
jgi:glycosyltransferase involved in cell wall biosynthesis